jgi:hypothetical protein
VPFRSRFDCLWCGTPHATRGPDDIEGWAQLCPTCIGRAGDNGFLRARLRRGMDERARARAGEIGAGGPTSGALADPSSLADDGIGSDDWYLRRGRHSQGAIADAAWTADLDAATLWLDGLPWRGEIVELECGSGWWSPLLATKGQLWCYDSDEAHLDATRSRLVAHGLRAHLHERDPWLEPDREVDGLFMGPLGLVPQKDLARFPALARRWLKPGGLFAFLDRSDAVDRAALERGLADSGFENPDVVTATRGLLYGSATAGPLPE